MDREFYYFNPRLTEKLNMIRRRPLTIVNAHRAAGKSTAIGAYLSNLKGKKIHQAVGDVSFQSWLFDFLMLLETTYQDSGFGGEATGESVRNAEDPAGRLAVYLKKAAREEPLYYVIEMGAAPQPEILNFLYQLARQEIHGLSFIVLSEAEELPGFEPGMCSRVNLIQGPAFLMRVTDIQQGFSEKGVPLAMEEAALVFRYTGGWAPLVSAVFRFIARNGKKETWLAMRDLARGWKERGLEPTILLRDDPENLLPEYVDGKEDITEELARIWNALLRLREQETTERVQRLRLKENSIRAEDACVLLILDCCKEAMAGRAQSAISMLERTLAERCESGRFAETETLALGGIFLKFFLGNEYTRPLGALGETILCGDLFPEGDRWGVLPFLRALILLRGGRVSELEALMEMTEVGTERAETTRRFFLALARAEKDKEAAARDLATVIPSLAKKEWRLPLVAFYEEICYLLPGVVGKREQKFIEEVKSGVNRYRRHMRKNYEKSGDAYGADLTRRQLEAAELAAQGLSNKEIAQRMNISENTVKTTMRAVFRKLNVTHRKELRSESPSE